MQLRMHTKICTEWDHAIIIHKFRSMKAHKKRIIYETLQRIVEELEENRVQHKPHYLAALHKIIYLGSGIKMRILHHLNSSASALADDPVCFLNSISCAFANCTPKVTLYLIQEYALWLLKYVRASIWSRSIFTLEILKLGMYNLLYSLKIDKCNSNCMEISSSIIPVHPSTLTKFARISEYLNFRFLEKFEHTSLSLS